MQSLSGPAAGNGIVTTLPDIEDDTQRNWTHLANEFVRDVSGETVEPYQTFKDGCLYQEIIDVIRKNNTWVDVSDLSLNVSSG